MPEDSGGLSVKRGEIEDVLIADWALKGCHKHEMVSIRQERWPTVGSFTPVGIGLGDLLWRTS